LLGAARKEATFAAAGFTYNPTTRGYALTNLGHNRVVIFDSNSKVLDQTLPQTTDLPYEVERLRDFGVSLDDHRLLGCQNATGFFGGTHAKKVCPGAVRVLPEIKTGILSPKAKWVVIANTPFWEMYTPETLEQHISELWERGLRGHEIAAYLCQYLKFFKVREELSINVIDVRDFDRLPRRVSAGKRRGPQELNVPEMLTKLRSGPRHKHPLDLGHKGSVPMERIKITFKADNWRGGSQSYSLGKDQELLCGREKVRQLIYRNFPKCHLRCSHDRIRETLVQSTGSLSDCL